MSTFKPVYPFLLCILSTLGVVMMNGCTHEGGYRDINGNYYYAATNGTYYNARAANTIEAAESANDHSLVSTVKQKLQSDEELKYLNIHVTGVKDQIELSGYVNNNTQRLKAIDIARRVPGVHLVADKLAVKLI